jgi:Mg2+ and Co2+ transporter CorA
MSIFAKKQDWDRDQKGTVDAAPTHAASAAPRGGSSHYGIAEAIQLLRGLPVDQNTELVVRVVRATLASLSVHLSDIIEDANRKQKTVQDKIASEHTKVADLEKQLADHRKEIASLEADLKETTTVKERLQMAEKSASAPAPLRGGASPAVVTTLLGNKLPDDVHKEAHKD